MNGQIMTAPAPSSTLPTQKYVEYRAEVEAKLAGKLSHGERRRLEHEYELLKRAQFITLNGVVHHYQDVGPRDGEPLVLVHGWDCSAFWWHHIIDPLAAAGYRVINYDLKGHGFSDNDPAHGYTVAGFSEDLRALGDALKLEPQHVASFSLGAFIALHYGATVPDRVRSLTFFNFSLMGYNRVASAVLPVTLDTIFNRVLRPITRTGFWPLPFVYARLVLAQNTPTIGDIKLGTLSLRYCEPAAIRISTHELARREVLDAVPEQMRRVKQPTLLVAGAGDPVMRPNDGRKLMALAQHGTYLEVPKCGHLILFELPEQVVQILRLFLRGVRG
ncbi:alpha/beta hydrolase fold protein [Oscillochloris trichoides DG-6]|uniref:Alpha/beta hydrolase fold protein n=1 Tax=Oscillochloris trichoides DG-6 TaxID=765420 RepID=E1ICN1_9CHLR|nr:alpha/beta hydrolase [Oscillochloris trichoides]EFO81051.1 alpha/beta hydrolase fold protein [Oscillochloris trichoides DG-6]